MEVYPQNEVTGDVTTAETQLYEDDGVTGEYRKGNYRLTEISANRTSESLSLKVASSGKYQGAPDNRDYSVKFKLIEKPQQVLLNNKPVSTKKGAEVKYDKENRSLSIYLQDIEVKKKWEIELKF
ncbi:MAG: DUF5110 domain-containing protein [bacterium]